MSGRPGVLVLGVALLVGAGAVSRDRGVGSGEPGLPSTVGPFRPSQQQTAPTVDTDLDTAEITVGDPVHLTVTVEHDAGSGVVWPDSINFGAFELLGAELLEPHREGGRVRAAVRFALTAFELGDLEIPSFDVMVTGPDSASSVALSTDVWTVTVASVGRDESGDIRDIKGPLEISRNWLLLLPWILAVGVVGAVAYWLYTRSGRRPQLATDVGAVAARPPHEVAYEMLDRLEASGLLEKGEIKAYYIEVSEIIRRYIEGRYRVDALEMATYEVLQGLGSAGVDLDTRLQFDRFLGDCDVVKFAKYRPEIGTCREILPRARRIVDDTSVVVGEGEEGEGGEEEVGPNRIPAASAAQRGEGAGTGQ